MKKSLPIIFYINILLITHSKCIKSSNSIIKFQEFNQKDYKDSKKKLTNYPISIYINTYNNHIIGYNGILDFQTEFNDYRNIFASSDIEKRTAYQTFYTEDKTGNQYNITCRLWKPPHGNLKLFCQLKEILSENSHLIRINDYNFNYDDYNINIYFHLNYIYILYIYYPIRLFRSILILR